MPKNILFLCVANSARSQMAEGLCRDLYPNRIVHSAGSKPTKPNPYAVTVMAEINIDITNQKSTLVDDVALVDMDLIITLCADEVCPWVPVATQRLHWPFDDPDSKDKNLPEAEMLQRFRRARNAIKDRLLSEPPFDNAP